MLHKMTRHSIHWEITLTQVSGCGGSWKCMLSPLSTYCIPGMRASPRRCSCCCRPRQEEGRHHRSRASAGAECLQEDEVKYFQGFKLIVLMVVVV